jgi:hypothetical protein
MFAAMSKEIRITKPDKRLLEKIKEDARKNFRSIPAQAEFILKKYYRIYGNT